MIWKYFERQRFTQWWIWLLSFLIAGVALTGIVQQVVLGRPFGNLPADNATVLTISTVLLLSVLFIHLIRLDIMVDERGLHVRYWPFMERHISLDQIVTVEHTNYGGVGAGIRLGSPHGIVYNIRGRQGVQLTLKSGERIFLGSRHPQRLEDMLKTRTP
jgi:hypothetical protein